MIVYSIILFAAAAVIIVCGVYIRRGKLWLIHDYHQTNVKPENRAAYGRAFSVGLFVLGAGLVLAAAIVLFGDDKPFVWASDAALAAGIIAGIVLLVRAQKKYNGGMF